MTSSAVPAAFADLRDWRAIYLASLPEPQEFHCERLSRRGRPFLLVRAGEVLGYFITDGASTLVEFHAVGGDLFDRLVEQTGIRRVLCKSFDEPLHAVCSRRAAKATTMGLLYRRIVDPGFTPDPAIQVRAADGRDVPAVMAANDGFFADDAEATAYVRAGQLYLYETGTVLAGCGLLQRVTPVREAYDVGMMVAPGRRRQGFGRYIVQHLVHLCLTAGKRPIAGCDIENRASQSCLESAGFRSEHQLIEFAW